MFHHPTSTEFSPVPFVGNLSGSYENDIIFKKKLGECELSKIVDKLKIRKFVDQQIFGQNVSGKNEIWIIIQTDPFAVCNTRNQLGGNFSGNRTKFLKIFFHTWILNSLFPGIQFIPSDKNIHIKSSFDTYLFPATSNIWHIDKKTYKRIEPFKEPAKICNVESEIKMWNDCDKLMMGSLMSCSFVLKSHGVPINQFLSVTHNVTATISDDSDGIETNTVHDINTNIYCLHVLVSSSMKFKVNEIMKYLNKYYNFNITNHNEQSKKTITSTGR